jgi:hypothetical protein
MQHVKKLLDTFFPRIRTNSANWSGQIVWDLKSNGIDEGVFILLDDNNEFILLYRTETKDSTYIEDLDSYNIAGGKLKDFLKSIISAIKL